MSETIEISSSWLYDLGRVAERWRAAPPLSRRIAGEDLLRREVIAWRRQIDPGLDRFDLALGLADLRLDRQAQAAVQLLTALRLALTVDHLDLPALAGLLAGRRRARLDADVVIEIEAKLAEKIPVTDLSRATSPEALMAWQSLAHKAILHSAEDPDASDLGLAEQLAESQADGADRRAAALGWILQMAQTKHCVDTPLPLAQARTLGQAVEMAGRTIDRARRLADRWEKALGRSAPLTRQALELFAAAPALSAAMVADGLGITPVGARKLLGRLVRAGIVQVRVDHGIQLWIAQELVF